MRWLVCAQSLNSLAYKRVMPPMRSSSISSTLARTTTKAMPDSTASARDTTKTLTAVSRARKVCNMVGSLPSERIRMRILSAFAHTATHNFSPLGKARRASAYPCAANLYL